jgi:hypothetical protein
MTHPLFCFVTSDKLPLFFLMHDDIHDLFWQLLLLLCRRLVLLCGLVQRMRKCINQCWTVFLFDLIFLVIIFSSNISESNNLQFYAYENF